ncbi:MAG: SDR family NAD(P)-dependent oxidoreductase [Puia sp.]
MNTKTKVVLITGGSRGLGKNMALAIAEKGIDVIITYNSNKEAADKVVSEIESLGQKAVAFQLDTSKINGFDNFIKQTTAYLQEQRESPKIDFLINNAGTRFICTDH